jgi:hypothetical protein
MLKLVALFGLMQKKIAVISMIRKFKHGHIATKCGYFLIYSMEQNFLSALNHISCSLMRNFHAKIYNTHHPGIRHRGAV